MFVFKKVDPSRKTQKNKQKYEYFEDLIERDYKEEKDLKRRYLNMLEECCQMTYSLHNFSLMPRDGGMNIFRGSRVQMREENKGQYLDRIDRFLYWLNDYYDKKGKTGLIEEKFEHVIFLGITTGGGKGSSKVTPEEREARRISNKKRLILFLNQFGEGKEAVYKYCSEMYLIDCKEEENRKLVEDLIENGSKPIENGEDVIRYMNLAKRYWKIKDELLKQANSTE